LEFVLETTCETTGSTLLLTDKIGAAYHLALLDEPYSEHVYWHLHQDTDGQADATAALYSLSRPTIIFLLGEADAVGECLARADLPVLAYIAYFPQHAAALNKSYRVPKPVEMQRMVLTSDKFELSRHDFARQRPAIGGEPIVLRPPHVELLEELYASEPGFAPDPHQYATGGYLGIFAEDKLLAAAGTHFVSEEHSFAMIGNVVTRPGCRRLGLATRAVISQLARLFDRVETVCLNVAASNSAAVKMYESLGFTSHCTYYEGVGVLRKVAVNAPQEGLHGGFCRFGHALAR